MGQKGGERKIHWIAWRKLCLPKNEGGLGFRDFKFFSWALLGKQAWTIFMSSDSLLGSMLKAKYCPHSSFLKAELGSSPSYAWRGIWEARWVVKRGLCWRISDRESVKIWKDHWIPGTQTRKIISPVRENNVDAEVSVLIDPIQRCWNRELISGIFLPFGQQRVLSILLSIRLPPDSLYRVYEKSGEYFVKTAYRAIIHDDAHRGLVSSLTRRTYGIKYGIQICCPVSNCSRGGCVTTPSQLIVGCNIACRA